MARSLDEAKSWFHRSLGFAATDLDRSDVYLTFGKGLLDLGVDEEATHWILLGTQLLRNRDVRHVGVPACHDHLVLQQDSETLINSTCLREELMGRPFFFNKKEADVLSRTHAIQQFHLRLSTQDP